MEQTLKAFWAGKAYCFVLYSALFRREVKAKLTLLFACHALAVGFFEASPFLKQPGITKTFRMYIFYFCKFKKVACSQGMKQLLILYACG